MSLKSYLLVMTSATLGSAVCLFIILLAVNPFNTNWLGLTLFYCSLIITIMGLAAIIGFVFRFVVLHKKLATSAVIISFRQAFLIAFLIALILYLLSHQLFSWFNMILLIIGFTTLEFFLISITATKNE